MYGRNTQCCLFVMTFYSLTCQSKYFWIACKLMLLANARVLLRHINTKKMGPTASSRFNYKQSVSNYFVIDEKRDNE